MFAVTLKLSSTTRNFPKFPVGLNMASRRPPTFPFAYPVFQDATKGALIAAAAPKHCKGIYNSMYQDNNYTIVERLPHNWKEKTDVRVQKDFETIHPTVSRGLWNLIG